MTSSHDIPIIQEIKKKIRELLLYNTKVFENASSDGFDKVNRSGYLALQKVSSEYQYLLRFDDLVDFTGEFLGIAIQHIFESKFLGFEMLDLKILLGLQSDNDMIFFYPLDPVDLVPINKMLKHCSLYVQITTWTLFFFFLLNI